MLEIMKEYGWDWEQFQNQPTWIIDLAYQKLSIESKLAAQAEKNVQTDGRGLNT